MQVVVKQNTDNHILSSMLHALRDVTKVGRVFPIPQKGIFNWVDKD